MLALTIFLGQGLGERFTSLTLKLLDGLENLLPSSNPKPVLDQYIFLFLKIVFDHPSCVLNLGGYINSLWILLGCQETL